jgi:hypothetical protein
MCRMPGYFQSWAPGSAQGTSYWNASPDQVSRVPGIQASLSHHPWQAVVTLTVRTGLMMPVHWSVCSFHPAVISHLADMTGTVS